MAEIADCDLDLTASAGGSARCAGILATAPQVVGVVFLTPELQAYRHLRDAGARPPEDWSRLEGMRGVMDRGQAGQPESSGGRLLGARSCGRR